MVEKSMGLYFAAAVATAIAGMLHLMLGPNNLGFNVNQGILFIAGGIYTGASTDGLVQSNAGQHLMLNLTGSQQGYTGTFNIAVNAG